VEGATRGSRLVGRVATHCDVLVVVSERALGQTSDEVAPTIRTLRRHNLLVKVLSHVAPTVRRTLRMHEADRR
jgi:hypothetical protein